MLVLLYFCDMKLFNLSWITAFIVTLSPLFSYSQHYEEGDSPIIDSAWFQNPEFNVHYNNYSITFTKIDSIVYTFSQVQDDSLTVDRSLIKKQKDSLIILMKTKKFAFIDDSSKNQRKYGLCQYEGYLKNIKMHLVKVLGWQSIIYYGILDNESIDTLWFADIIPTLSNAKIVGYQYQGKFYQVCVDSFDADKKRFKELWDFSFLPQQLYGFKWINENQLLAIISEHHKKKYYYKISFRED